MKKTVRWDNLTAPQLAKLAEENAVVLLPTGSTEQHGPHLPVGCDAILATWFAERAAAGRKRAFPPWSPPPLPSQIPCTICISPAA